MEDARMEGRRLDGGMEGRCLEGGVLDGGCGRVLDGGRVNEGFLHVPGGARRGWMEWKCGSVRVVHRGGRFLAVRFRFAVRFATLLP